MESIWIVEHSERENIRKVLEHEGLKILDSKESEITDVCQVYIFHIEGTIAQLNRIKEKHQLQESIYFQYKVL